MKVQEVFKDIKSRISQLGRRQKLLLSLLILSLIFSLYFNKLIKPQVKTINQLRLESAELNQKIMKMELEMSPLEREKAELEELKRNNQQFQKKLAGLEKELPSSYRIYQLLGELAKLTQGLQIEFSYIKPKIKEVLSEEEYVRLDIEMQFCAPYLDLRSYLSKLEELSGYLNITEIVIEEIKEGDFPGETIATLVLSALLSRDSERPLTLALEEKDISHKENPFLSKKISKQSKYILSGITFAGAKSTAIINNKVYRKGELLDNKYRIEQILPNMVIVSRGRQKEALILE